MNKQEYLLVKLMEECAEVQKEAAKCLVFGLNTTQNTDSLANVAKLQAEISDVSGIIEALYKEGIDIRATLSQTEAKMDKVEFYMGKSREIGTLEE